MGQLAICQMKYLPSFLALLLGLAKQNKTKKKKRIPLAKRNTNLPTDLVYFIPKVDGFARKRVNES